MSGPRNRQEQMWSVGWIVLIRLVVYLVIVGFFLQYAYFTENTRVVDPEHTIFLLVGVFVVNLFLLAMGFGHKGFNWLIVATYVFDLLALTRAILSSGGFNSMLIPYYLPVLVMAPAWLPRRFTALFPALATLGLAYIGCAHLLLSDDRTDLLPWLFPDAAFDNLRNLPAHTVVTNMLILSVLFFVVSYLAGFLSSKLFLAQRLNQEVLSSMKEGVGVLSADRQLVYANDEFFRMFPEAAKEGGLLASLRAAIPDFDEFVASGENLGGDTLVAAVEANDQSRRPPMEVRISTISIKGESAPYGLVFLVSDLSLRKRMERVERDLEHFSAISTMAAGLAHEIRNPLAALRSAMQEIGESFSRDSQNRTLTDVVISESDRLDGVVGRFLDFSREGELRLGRCRLGRLLEDTRTLVMRDKEPGSLEMNIDIRSDPEVTADSDRLRQVFLNLALNASQAVPPKGGRIDIVLDDAANDGLPGVEALFLDNGHGLSEEEAKHLFEPFYSRRSGGTGMGLPLSRKQVSMHGGEITASNRPEGGACFRVWLPLVAAKRRTDTVIRRKMSERWR